MLTIKIKIEKEKVLSSMWFDEEYFLELKAEGKNDWEALIEMMKECAEEDFGSLIEEILDAEFGASLSGFNQVEIAENFAMAIKEISVVEVDNGHPLETS